MRFFRTVFSSRVQDIVLPALLAFLCALIFYNNYATTLTAVHNGIIGIATYDGVDVAARIRRFYYTGFIFGISFLLFIYVCRILFLQHNFSRRDAVYLNEVTAAALLALIGGSFTSPEPTTLIINFIAIALANACFLLFVPAALRAKINRDKIAVSIALAFMAQALLTDMARYTNHSVSQVWYTAITVVVYLLAITAFVKSKKAYKLLAGSLPVVCIPVIYPLSCELWLLSQKHGLSLSALHVYELLLAMILVCSAINFFRAKKERPQSIVIAIGCMLVISTVVAATYQYISSDWQIENFELANPANAMMNIFRYHQLPIADFYTSHLLSEQWYGLLYFLLHGYDGSLDFLVYFFLLPVAGYAVVYFFLYEIFRRVWQVVFMLIFIPFIPELVFPNNYFFILVCFLAMVAYMQRPHWRRMVIVMIAILLSLLWRVDNAVVALPAVGASLLIWAYHFRKWSALWRAVIWQSAGLVIVITALTLYLNVTRHDIAGNLRSALEYIGASQAHGFSDIMSGVAYSINTAYFLLPAVAMLLCIFIWFRYYQHKTNIKELIVITFFTIVFVLNYQRGLVRHTIANEGMDKFFVSFIFFLLPYQLLVVFNIRRHKFWAFTTLAFFFLMAFKVPVPREGKTLADAAITTMEQRCFPTEKNMDRIRGWTEHKQAFAAIDSFFTANFSADASFIDLSNTPLLYYILQRPVPGYFCQYVQNMVTAATQQRNVQQLTKLNLPIAVFSSWPKHEFFDKTDGVENNIRYYKLSNYIFNNYRPLGVISGRNLWLKKDIVHLRWDNTSHLPDSVIYAPELYDIKRLAYLWAKNAQHLKRNGTTLVADSSGQWRLPSAFSKKNGNYLMMEIVNNSSEERTIQVSYQVQHHPKGSLRFVVTPHSTASYLVPVSTQYNWHVFHADAIDIEDSSGSLLVKSVSLFEGL